MARSRSATHVDRLAPQRDGRMPTNDAMTNLFKGATPLAFILAIAGCGKTPERPASEASGERPNVVVVLVDDLRFDEFHAAGHPYLETPNIDRLAAEGARFVNSFHAVPLCSPNRATLLTGQFPSRHGIIDNLARDLTSHHLETPRQSLRASRAADGRRR